MAVTSETLRLVAALRREMSAITDHRTRDLTKRWVEAWDDLAPIVLAGIDDVLAAADGGQWPSRTTIIRASRAMLALDLAQAELARLARLAGADVADDLTAAVTAAGEAHAQILASQYPAQAGTRAEVAARFDNLDPRAVDAIVGRTTQQVTSALLPLSDAAYQGMLRSLVQGVAMGDNPRVTARRMLERVEGEFNGGLTRALVIARTETLDAHREAARAARLASRDVVAGWTWHCSLDRRACPACWSKHGTTYPADRPGPWGHQQCRCVPLPLSKSWADLGFTGITEPASMLPDAQAVFKGLPRADQLAVMGPARLAALDSGTASWADLARRRETPTWRPSYTPTPVGALT